MTYLHNKTTLQNRAERPIVKNKLLIIVAIILFSSFLREICLIAKSFTEAHRNRKMVIIGRLVLPFLAFGNKK